MGILHTVVLLVVVVSVSAQTYLGCFRSLSINTFETLGAKQCISTCINRNDTMAAVSSRQNETTSNCFCSSNRRDFEQIGQYCGVKCIDLDGFACGRMGFSIDFSVYSNISLVFSRPIATMYQSMELNDTRPFISRSAGCLSTSNRGSEVESSAECIGVCEQQSALIAGVRYDEDSQKYYCVCSYKPTDFKNEGWSCGLRCPDSPQTGMTCGSAGRNSTFTVYSQPNVDFSPTQLKLSPMNATPGNLPSTQPTNTNESGLNFNLATAPAVAGVTAILVAIAAAGLYVSKNRRKSPETESALPPPQSPPSPTPSKSFENVLPLSGVMGARDTQPSQTLQRLRNIPPRLIIIPPPPAISPTISSQTMRRSPLKSGATPRSQSHKRVSFAPKPLYRHSTSSLSSTNSESPTIELQLHSHSRIDAENQRNIISSSRLLSMLSGECEFPSQRHSIDSLYSTGSEGVDYPTQVQQSQIIQMLSDDSEYFTASDTGSVLSIGSSASEGSVEFDTKRSPLIRVLSDSEKSVTRLLMARKNEPRPVLPTIRPSSELRLEITSDSEY
ncbi:hypothetical protein BDR26DRAFT_1003952 [Obelidium mucronatum]|nr:hypothetical protein BDR26DRAFT_1003952 [Obelidium mucronatum]